MSQAYPDDSIQNFVGTWWTSDDTRDFRRGRLLRAFVPFPDQQPLHLSVEGRTDPREHGKANFSLEPLDPRRPYRAPQLPVAALPDAPGEIRVLYKGKVRPVLVVSPGGPDIDSRLRIGAAKWQSAPAMLVAPAFGVAADGTRGGWREEFVARIRRCEYPQYLWDRLPIGGAPDSVIRLDHSQPLGRHGNSSEWTPHCLTDDALTILDEWLGWLITGLLPEDSVLAEFRRSVLGSP